MKNLPLIASLLALGCSTAEPRVEPVAAGQSRSGRELALRQLDPPQPASGLFTRQGLLATARSSLDLSVGSVVRGTKHLLRGFDPEFEHSQVDFEVELSDGTRVGGLLFEYDDETDRSHPLLLMSFGFLQDRWGTEMAKLHKLYLSRDENRLAAHVLVLDHPSSGPFLANNGNLSMGSYDDARMWIEVAQIVQSRMELSGIHLFGVSMSGQTVVHALIEDARLGLGLFRSGVAASIAPDFQQAPAKQLAWLPTREGVENPWRRGSESEPATLVDRVQGRMVWVLFENRFLPSYRRVRPEADPPEVEFEDLAVLLRRAFESRIDFLRREGRYAGWNTDFSLADLDSFLATTRIAVVIERVRTPLVLVSARDDPAVESRTFEEVVEAARGNPWVAARETEYGGHFGFDAPYGAGYIEGIVELLLDPEVLHSWNGREVSVR